MICIINIMILIAFFTMLQQHVVLITHGILSFVFISPSPPHSEESCHVASYKRDFSPLLGKPGSSMLDLSCTNHEVEEVAIGFPFPYLSIPMDN